MKLNDTSRLQGYLKIDPCERTEQLLNQIYDEVYFFEFFRYLSQSDQKNFVLKYCCKYMTCLQQKKKQIEQNRDCIWIILDGELNTYIPTQIKDNEEQKQSDKPKRKFFNRLTQGQCLNLTTVCFKKITSFYYECQDQVTLLSIPSFADNISLIKQIYPIVKADYDSIFETLIQFDQFYTQQQVRDILFVSKRCIFKKGNIQLKGNGVIIFIVYGEFSIFKDFYKGQVQQKDNQHLNRYQKEEESHKNNQTSSSEDEFSSSSQNQIETDLAKFELQKLKMKFKKRNTQIFKRIQLGIKKPGSLVVLGKKEDSVDGVECMDGEGIAFVCTEDQYNSITKEQEKKTNVFQALINNQNIQNTNGQQDNPQSKNQQNDQKNQNSFVVKVQSKLNNLNKNNIKRKSYPNTPKQFNANENQKQQQKEEEDDALKQQLLDENTTSTINSTSKGDELRTKYELDYRKSLINNIGQQLNTYSKFIYSNKGSKKVVSNKGQAEMLNLIQLQNQLNPNDVNEKLDLKMFQTQNTQSTSKLNDQDEQKINHFSNTPKRKLNRKSLINPLLKSSKETIRGTSYNKLPNSQENIGNQSSQTQIEQSYSSSALQECTLVRETSIQKRIQQTKKPKIIRSQSLFQNFAGIENAANLTPKMKVGKQMIANTSIETIYEKVPNSPQKIRQQSQTNFTTKYHQIINSGFQNQQKSEYSASPSNFLEYNFLSTPNHKSTDVDTPNSINFSNYQESNFSEKCQSVFNKAQTLKKSNHFANSEQNLLRYNSPQSNKGCRKINLKVRMSTCDTQSMLSNQQPEAIGSQSHRQFSNTIQSEESSTQNAARLSNFHQYQSQISNKSQRPLKETPQNNIRSLINIPSQVNIANTSSVDIQKSLLNLQRRVQSAKNPKAQSNKLHLDIQKQDNQQSTILVGSKTTTNKEKLHEKNIIQILYPQKASIQERKKNTILKKSKKSNQDHLTINSPSMLNQEYGVQRQIENEFKVFLQKKLRPQSAINRYQGEKQINQLNKKVFGQFVQSLNNTPQNQQQKQQQPQLQINNYQTLKQKTFSNFSKNQFI